jgi:aminoglycoside phosphotransferase (APT) family kinase protein
MVARQPARGELIARGNTSDVWRWSDTSVVKVLRPEIPEHWARLEAEITQAVHQAGLPVPATDGVVDVDGRPGLVLERIEGASMWSDMKAHPADVPRLVDELVDLQAQVLSAGSLDGVPDLVTRLRAKIAEADQLPAVERHEAQLLLASLPTGSALCHGDMHPANLLRAARGWVIVDWFDAAIGHQTADLARSSLLMPPASAVESAGRHLDGATANLLERLHEAYLAALARRGLIDSGPFAAWEAVLAVARMSEPVQTTDLHTIWRAWRMAHRPT